jgi:membrane peptidoglycan carboxypeptidase
MIIRRKARKERRAAQRARTRLITGLIAGVIALLIGVPLVVFAGGALFTYSAAVADFPRPADTTFVGSLRGATRLTDLSGGTVIYAVEDPLGASRRWITLDELPDYVIAATLLVEDQGFYERPRFDPLATALRLWENLLNGPLRADASLTGRLVRNAIAPPPEFVTVEDRSREIALIAETERRYTPDEILEWHLNTNYYGNEAYGIEAAARVYLGKAAADLTLDEAALLASIPTAPQFNPIDDETAARGRQADTLRRLLVANVVTSGEYDEASRALTVINTSLAASPAVADDFSIYARRQAESILNRLGMDGGRMVSRGGLTITTSLDLDLYYQAECALRAHLNRLNGRSEPVAALNGSACVAADELPPLAAADFGAAPPDSGTVVILDPVTGVVRAMVGAATRVENQPAMTLAPFAYFEGFRESRQGTQYTPASMLLDIPQRFPGAAEGLIYQPANPDGVFRGPLSLREAAAEGLIPPVTQVADNHSLSNILRTAHRLGVNSLDDALYDLSLFDRGGVVSALDVAYAYSVFAAMGDMYGVEARPRGTAFRNRDPVAVLRIEDSDGRVLWAYDPQASRVNVFSSFSELGYLINSIYSDRDARRQKFGSDNPLLVSRTAAVVNSTAGNRLDNWTVGYTPQAVVAVHLDRADTNPFTLDGYGLDGAAHVWHALTEYVHRGLPPADWPRPANIVERQVCQISGLLPNSACPVRREIFINGIVPAANDSFWQSIEINGQTGQLATFNTPNALRVNETYFIPPDEALDWWRANNQKLPPTTYDVLSRPDNALFNTAVLTQPEALAWIRGTVEVRGVINDPAFAAYQLRFGEGAINPQNWFNIGERQTVNPEDGLLGVWDTSGLDGVYTIELTVESTNGARQRAVTQVRVDNIPPSVILTAGEQGKVYRWPSETVIPLAADVRDNLAVERVEFYNNGRLVFTDSDAPYAYDFAIAGIGIQSFSVVAYDAAGNQNNSAEVFVEVTR